MIANLVHRSTVRLQLRFPAFFKLRVDLLDDAVIVELGRIGNVGRFGQFGAVQATTWPNDRCRRKW